MSDHRQKRVAHTLDAPLSLWSKSVRLSLDLQQDVVEVQITRNNHQPMLRIVNHCQSTQFLVVKARGKSTIFGFQDQVEVLHA